MTGNGPDQHPNTNRNGKHRGGNNNTFFPDRHDQHFPLFNFFYYSTSAEKWVLFNRIVTFILFPNYAIDTTSGMIRSK